MGETMIPENPVTESKAPTLSDGRLRSDLRKSAVKVMIPMYAKNRLNAAKLMVKTPGSFSAGKYLDGNKRDHVERDGQRGGAEINGPSAGQDGDHRHDSKAAHGADGGTDIKRYESFQIQG
jgi:hypothetical protein